MLHIPQELLGEMTPAVRAFVESLLAENTALRKRVEELARRLGMNSGNSSLPPSSDGPGQQPVAAAKPKSNRKCGGQCRTGNGEVSSVIRSGLAR
jgi:anti-sigma factor RsiW